MNSIQKRNAALISPSFKKVTDQHTEWFKATDAYQNIIASIPKATLSNLSTPLAGAYFNALLGDEPANAKSVAGRVRETVDTGSLTDDQVAEHVDEARAEYDDLSPEEQAQYKLVEQLTETNENLKLHAALARMDSADAQERESRAVKREWAAIIVTGLSIVATIIALLG